MTSKSNLVINPQRLWDSIMETAKFGGTPKGGIKRLTVSDEDKRVRDWFKAQCEALGCTVQVDSVGNMFATRAGQAQGLCCRSPWARISIRSRRAASLTACWVCSALWRRCARWWTWAMRPMRR